MEKKMEKMRNEIVGQNKFYGAIAALGIAQFGNSGISRYDTKSGKGQK